jgi:hypothetical protein
LGTVTKRPFDRTYLVDRRQKGKAQRCSHSGAPRGGEPGIQAVPHANLKAAWIPGSR